MRSFRLILITLVALLALASCKSNPEVAQKRYVESGDKYFNKGRYKEAAIQYRNAIRINPKYGLAHYKLALTALKMDPPDWAGAVNALRRASQVINPDQPEHWDAVVKLSELYMALAPKDAQLMKEVEQNCKDLLDRNPDSFDGHRLTGDWKYLEAMEQYRVKRTDEASKEVDEALAEYRKADAVKPGDQGVTLQVADVMTTKGLLLDKDQKGDVPAAKIQFDAAERLYRQVIDRKKDYLPAYRKLYVLLWKQNRRAEAEQVLKAGFQSNPKEYGFLIWLAEQYLYEGRTSDVVAVLAQLKSKASDHPSAFRDAGDFYLRMGDPESAVREYRDGMAKDARNKATYEKRIVEVLARQNKMAEAKDVNDQILKDNPKDSDALGVKATLLLDSGEVAAALPGLQQVVTRAPDNPVAHFNLGRAYLMHNEAENARQQFQKAIELRPDYIPARFAMGQLQLRRGEFEAAIQTAGDILKLDPNSASAKLMVSAGLIGLRKFGESRNMLDAMLKGNASSPDVLYQLGVLDLAEQKFKDAEDTFRRGYQLNPANTRGLMGLVETYLAQNKTDAAIQLLQAESAKTPTRADFHVALGNVGVRSGRWDMAISQFQTVLASAPKGSKVQGEMYLRIGEAQRRKGDFNSAIVSLQAARQTLPEDRRVLSTLGLTLDGAHRWNEAKQVYQATYKLYPTDAVTLNNLAFGLAEHGEDLDQALSLAQRAKQLLSGLPDVSDTLGWIYLKKGLADNAIEIFQPLVASYPNETTFRYHLGRAYQLKGDKVRAVEELKKALSGSPKPEERKEIQDLIASMK
jgi:tetratricopeptide (TPR) repeat protein